MIAIDLFAGAGGFSLAAHECNVDVVAAIELDNAASKTYRHNLVERLGNQTLLINDDVNEVDINELMSKLDLAQGDLDLLLGGPPCQGFSTHRINDSGINDPRNALLLRYFDFVNRLRPKSFLVENVTGLLWERHADYLNKFLDLASQNGYAIKYCDVLNAKDFGVPQNRKRVFILGIANELNSAAFTFPPPPTHSAPNNGLPVWKAASTVFETPPQDIINDYINLYEKKMGLEEATRFVYSLQFGEALPVGDSCNIRMQHTKEVAQRFSDTPLNGSRTDIAFTLDCHQDYVGHKDVYGRIIIHLPSNTITTGCNNPSKGRFVHPWLNHGITLRHAARFQTFPDDFVFLGNSTEQARQIGNAVPVALGQILIASIRDYLRTLV